MVLSFALKMDVRTLSACANLELAWRRLNTARNLLYKHFFRDLYHSYELALDQNLEDLQERLRSGSFKPNSPVRIYVPKSSGLQRPITLLMLEDQIVLQALANLYADRLRAKRKDVEMKFVFSNVLNSKAADIFFFRDWHQTYRRFTRAAEKHFADGFQWVGDFDLAAFYDTVSHDLLLKALFPRGGSREFSQTVCDWLGAWTSETSGLVRGHGIPQGPIASDFLAECFLLPVDAGLIEGGVRYIRYADDIRIFGRSETEVQKGTIRLEILCRNRGLIPQGSKCAIRRVSSTEEARGNLPSLAIAGQADDVRPALDGDEGLQLMQSAIAGRPKRIVDKSRARFVLFNSDKNPKLLECALKMIPRHPEHIDALAHFIGRYSRSRTIIRVCKECLETIPYEYVQGELWHILARMMSPTEMKDLIEKAVQEAKAKSRCVGLSWGVLHFLCRADRLGLGDYADFAMYQKSIVQALIVQALPPRVFLKPQGPVREFLRRTSPETGLALAEALSHYRVTPATFGIDESSLPKQVRNVYAVLGLLSGALPQIDPIGEILDRRYRIGQWQKWKDLFGGEYVHAQKILCQAEAAFESSASTWLGYQNSFNHALFLALQTLIHLKGLPGAIRTVDRKGELISFGTLLQATNAFSTSHTVIADVFRASNDRRNGIPGSHPYQTKGGAQTRYVTKKEKQSIRTGLGTAYREVINQFDPFLP